MPTEDEMLREATAAVPHDLTIEPEDRRIEQQLDKSYLGRLLLKNLNKANPRSYTITKD